MAQPTITIHLPIAFVLLLCALLAHVNAHGFMCEPRQRGILEKNPFQYCKPIMTGMDRKCYDWKPHFPSGNKAFSPGSGKRSQAFAGGTWTPYEPTRPGFRFRAGPCGDQVGRTQYHMRGGRYYCPADKPKIVATYWQGGVVNVDMTIIAHHNGFIELTICDVKRCGGEISYNCLRNGRICRKLRRAYDEVCELKKSRECGPIDPNYPTRWYLPCRKGKRSNYKQIKFKLPNDLTCEHCVIQWYYVSADDCNPPGIVEYFRGPKGPKWWGQCPGNGGAKGGYQFWRTCGGKKFSEEYYQCSDVTVKPRKQIVRKPPPKPKKRSAYPFRFVRIYGNQKPIANIHNKKREWVPICGRKISMEALVKRPYPLSVEFQVQGQKQWTETRVPFVFLGNNGRRYTAWKPPIGRWMWVQLSAKTRDGRFHFFTFHLYFTHRGRVC